MEERKLLRKRQKEKEKEEEKNEFLVQKRKIVKKEMVISKTDQKIKKLTFEEKNKNQLKILKNFALNTHKQYSTFDQL